MPQGPGLVLGLGDTGEQDRQAIVPSETNHMRQTMTNNWEPTSKQVIRQTAEHRKFAITKGITECY